MKALELNNEQKEKLLTICKKLFPEYVDIFVNKYVVRLVTSWEDLKSGTQTQQEFIPWFEFCIKYVIPKLSDDIQSSIDLRILFCELPNPVDYLYKQFKNIKKL